MPVTEITDAGDPRLHDYRALTEHRLREDGGKFVAESEPVVRKLLSSGLGVQSILVTAPRMRSLEQATIPTRIPVFLVPQDVMDAVAGFHVHRGCLAIGQRPAAALVPDDASLVVVLENLVDVDNVGAMIRNACAFGADALVLSPRCADPFYRKAIRVAMGNTFFVPLVRAAAWPDALHDLDRRGIETVAAVLDPTVTALGDFPPPARVALVFGSEGPGLSAGALAACRTRVTIPMTGADSLNVATAAAICLHHIVTRRSQSVR